MADASITIVIPISRQGPAILPVLDALEKQDGREYVKEVCVVGLRDDPTNGFIEQHRVRSGYRIRFMHVHSGRLVDKYNHSMRMAETRFVIPIHADSLVVTEHIYANFLAAFEGRPDVVVATSILTSPKWVYDRYGFWQKCLYARGVGFEGESHMGNFTMFDRDLLMSRVGLFDPAFSHCGGEDNDLHIRIVQSGLAIAKTTNRIVHLHQVADRDSCECVIHRERICAEAYGTHLRKHGVAGYPSMQSLLLTFFRLGLVMGLLVPYLRIVSAALIVAYAFLYTGRVFREECRDWRIVLLPLFNVCLLPLNTFYTLRGFFGYRPAPPASYSVPR